MKCIFTMRFSKGFTLPEIALTIGLVVMLSTGAISSGLYVQRIQQEAKIHTALETLLAAQRFYLIDHPSESYASLVFSVLTPYFPGGLPPPLPNGSLVSISVYPPTISWKGKLYYAKEY